jgi:hypothetical protein
MPKNHEPQNQEEKAWVDPATQAKLDNEAWLQEHYRVVVPLLILAVLAMFILPLVFLSFLEALCIQIGGAGLLYILGKKYTTAFGGKRPF